MEAAKKKVLLGVTGSIAAYKIAILVRLLIKKDYKVRVVMTKSATLFVSPLTLSTLSNHPVLVDVMDDDNWNNHVALGLWADVYVIAPTTANTLGKLANGLADSMVTATYLSAKCPVMIAPAMDLDMWHHPSTKENLRKVQAFGNTIIPVGYGFLASGLEGDGRMAEVEDIVTYIDAFFTKKEDLKGKKVLITAGPTFEALDPVRFIGNHSSGKMGIALAEEAHSRGAEVVLVLGPTHYKPMSAIKTIAVQSAQEMYEACNIEFSNSDVIILAAAVADYRAKEISDKKIKKSDAEFQIELVKNIDIAATLGKSKQNHQCMIGFALETNDEIANAIAKIHKKNFDFIVLNSLNDQGAGFKHDTNKITLIDKKEQVTTYPLKPKTEVAVDIIDAAVAIIHQK